VRGANASEPPGYDLAALGHKALQKAHIAVGDRIDLLGAELADLLAAEELAAARRATGGPSARPSAGAGPEPEPGPEPNSGLNSKPGWDSAPEAAWEVAGALVSGAFA